MNPLNPNNFRTQEIKRIKGENDSLKQELHSLRTFVQALDRLYDSADAFKDDSELMNFLAETLSSAMQILNAPDGTLALVDEDEDQIEFVIVQGELSDELTGHRIPRTEGIAGWVIRNAKATMVRDVRRDQRFYTEVDNRFSFKTQSIAAAPLIGDGKIYGLVEVLNQPGDEPFSEGDMGILKLFCRAAGDALAKIDKMGEK
ncbi:MAG: GAF domain-containing protein [Chloroflexota bacterium]